MRVERTRSVFTTSRGRRCRIGYTLIELLIVVAILGISSAVLVPHLVNRDSLKVQAAVRLIISDLSFAQCDALAHQEMRRVHFFSSGAGYCIVRIDQGELASAFDESDDDHDYIADPLASGAELGHYIVDFTADQRFDTITITAVDIDGGERDINYDSLGGTINLAGGPGTGGTIRVSSPDGDYLITIGPFTGKLTVQEL